MRNVFHALMPTCHRSIAGHFSKLPARGRFTRVASVQDFRLEVLLNQLGQSDRNVWIGRKNFDIGMRSEMIELWKINLYGNSAMAASAQFPVRHFS